MIKVNGGTFWMGAQKTDPDGQNYDEDLYDDESPVHQVTLSEYWIGKYEVTQGVWKAVMDGNNPSNYKAGDNYPVENVSWDKVYNLSTGFIKKLNDLTASQRGNSLEFRLPTEAEWEFAARGGNKSNGYKYSGNREIDAVAWYKDNSAVDGTNRHHPVGRKQSNELGIYDMSGNVEEWCSDRYDKNYYQECFDKGIVPNPIGPTSGRNRILRGGHYNHLARNCRVSYRNGPEQYQSIYRGFRLASSSNPTSTASASAAKPKIEVTVEVQVIKD